jgi:signal transduction histidine kinase
MTASPRRNDPFQLKLDTFLSGSARIESDRKIYRILLLAGCGMLYAIDGPVSVLALLLFYLAVDESYGWHQRWARKQPLEMLGRRGYVRLLAHYTSTVVCFSAISIAGAATGTMIGASMAVLLTMGQVFNSISYETRSKETSIIAAIVIAITWQICAAGIAYSHGLKMTEWIFLNVAAALLSVYFTHVLIVTAQTHRNLIDRTEALAVATRGQTVGRLASGIAHDFNNLLTVMRGNIDLINEVPEADRSVLLRDIGEAADRGGKLVRKLLDQNRVDVADVQQVGLATFVATFITFARRVLPSNIKLRSHCEPDLVLETEPHLLEAALLNLVVNARDAMPAGGNIEISVRAATPDDAPSSDISFVQLQVSDTGHGMSDDVLAHATDALTTTKAPGKGTGLGLAMVLSFAQEAGGDLRITSTVGRGTTVTVFLPG